MLLDESTPTLGPNAPALNAMGIAAADNNSTANRHINHMNHTPTAHEITENFLNTMITVPDPAVTSASPRIGGGFAPAPAAPGGGGGGGNIVLAAAQRNLPVTNVVSNVTYSQYVNGSIFSVPKSWTNEPALGDSLVVSVYSFVKAFLRFVRFLSHHQKYELTCFGRLDCMEGSVSEQVYLFAFRHDKCFGGLRLI